MSSITDVASTTTFYERAFRKLHRVLTFGPHRDTNFWSAQAATLKDHAFYREGTAEHWLDLHNRLAKRCDIVTPRGIVDLGQLQKRLPSDFQPDLFVWFDQYDWNIPIRLETLRCPKVAVFGDTHIHRRHPDKWDTWLKYARLFDYIFVTFNRHHAVYFEEAGSPRVYWLPAACDPAAHFRIDAEKIYPVSFVGSTHKSFHLDRIRLLNSLRENLIDTFVDTRILEEMSLVFSRSKIIFNKSIGDDLNMRVFEALATGSLLLTNRLIPEAGLEELFTDREHLVIYDESNLINQIRFYLENESEREKIAEAGRQQVLHLHTYDHRIQQILQTLRENPL